MADLIKTSTNIVQLLIEYLMSTILKFAVQPNTVGSPLVALKNKHTWGHPSGSSCSPLFTLLNIPRFA